MMSLSFMIRSSSPSILTSVPDHLPNSTLSLLHLHGDDLAVFAACAWTDSDDLALLGLKPKDKVLFGKWSGTEVKIDGQEVLIMKESDVMGVLTN